MYCLKGMDVVRLIESQKTNVKDQPLKDVIISNCGSEEANFMLDINQQI